MSRRDYGKQDDDLGCFILVLILVIVGVWFFFYR